MTPCTAARHGRASDIRHAPARRTHAAVLVCALIAAACIAAPRQAHAQARSDSTAQRDTVRPAGKLTVPADSSRGGSSVTAQTDTTLHFGTKNATDTIVVYKAKDSVVYKLDDKRMHMFGAADIAYGATGIKAERITIDWDAGSMAANGIPDTTKGREGKLIGTPEFKEGADVYHGDEMTYNFRTKHGVITEGRTTIDDGFYLGERIKRMGEECYFISNGKYTTCNDPDHKHYYFGSPRMKVVPNDVIVAEPIILFVEDIPLFALPFAVIPSKSGRSSGIIIPTFGDDYYRGRYLKGGGYYWAASDYWDARLTGDWYAKGGYLMNMQVQYALRYNFSGSVQLSYGRQTHSIGNPYAADDLPSTDYSLVLRHNQTLDPLSRISADFSFFSNSYYNNFSHDLTQLLTQSARSSAQYSTSWEGTSRSLSVNASRDQDLRAGTWNMVLPDVSFTQGQVFPFRKNGSTGDGPWYELLGFDYRARGLHQLSLKKRTEIDGTDTTHFTDMFSRRGIQHNMSLLFTPRIGYVTLQPSFSVAERWYDHRTEQYYDAADSTVKSRDVDAFSAIHTFSFGVSANTKLYGTLNPNVLGILGIRHTLQPSISYSYNPDFSKTSWGYYQTYRNARDSVVRYDPYSGYTWRPGEVFGGVGSGESQTIGIGLSNIFEMKVSPAEGDTTLTPRKFQLFNLNASTSYNFVKDSLRLSNLSFSFRTNVQNLLDVYGGASVTPYVWEPARFYVDSTGVQRVRLAGHEINRYLYQDGSGIGRLTSFDIHLSTQLSSEMFAPKADTNLAKRAMEQAQSQGVYSFRMKWSLSLGYDYSMTQYDPENKSRSSSMRASLTFDPTPGWHVSASTYYDLVTRTVGTPRITMTRDLHCWEMLFSWTPTGPYREYTLTIRLRAPQLQDIKLEKKGSDRGVY